MGPRETQGAGAGTEWEGYIYAVVAKVEGIKHLEIQICYGLSMWVTLTHCMAGSWRCHFY